MAPLTRQRALAGNAPGPLHAVYYEQRSSPGGLIITEATQISQRGQGYPGTPGIHSPEQVAGWRQVSNAVHAKGGVIFLQLWHVGRISHSSHQPDGGPPFAPSAIKPAGNAQTAAWQSAPFETPRELSTAQIAAIVEDYRAAASNALIAGFDGVELHAANGYLPDQFLRDGSNRRTDGYGGSIANRARFLFEVLEAIRGVAGSDRVGVRLSPFGTFNDMRDSDPRALFEYVIPRLDEMGLAYLHLIEARYDRGEAAGASSGAAPTAAVFRPYFSGTLIDAGGFTKDSAQQAIAEGTIDAAAFGRLFISNPDLPLRLRTDASLNAYDRSTFSGGGAEGYVDYPALEGARGLAAEACCS